MIEDVRNLSGGKKQMWLRNNRDLVIKFCDQFGPDEACEKFNLERETLEKVYQQSNQEVPFSKADKAYMMAMVAKEAANETKREVRDLKKQFGEFQNDVASQVAQKVLLPWIQAAMQISEDLENGKNEDFKLSVGKKDDFSRL